MMLHGSVLLSRRVSLVWGIKHAFSPFCSGVEARVAHSDALRRNGSEEPEWSLRNGGCVAGLSCDDENEGRGKDTLTEATMDTALWTVQVLWGFFFSLTGFGKVLCY